MFNLARYIPDAFAQDVFEIDYSELKKIGIVTLVFDADRTIIPYRGKKLSETVIDLIAHLKAMGFRIVIVSNTIIKSRSRRAEALAESADIGCVCLRWKRRKPKPDGIQEAMILTKSTPKETAVIGDEFCRDILAAKRAKVRWSIMVGPLGWHPFWQYLAFPTHRLIDTWVRHRLISED